MHGGWTLLLLLGALSGAAVALTARGVHVAGTLPTTRFEAYLELAAVTVGALVAAWVALSSALALGCLAVRAGGRTWAAGERIVARHAPAVVRRAARIGVSMTVGAGLVLGAGTAHATEGPDADRAPVVAVDLGWRASAPEVAPRTVAGGPVTSAVETERRADRRSGDAVPSVDGTDAPDGTTGPAPVPTGTSNASGVPTTDDAPASWSLPVEAPRTTSGTEGPRSDASTETGPRQAAAHPVPPTDADAALRPGGTGAGTTLVRSGSTLPAAERDAALTVTRERSATGTEVVVLRGDTLWDIAARSLPTAATDADVAAAVARWHAANAAVIGGDPDLIRPGQVLVAPSA
ncbi:LysM peptidoglycan-binding domain-containing protein [Cellulosimicrobium sp. Marseille-Q4280]|uniref:LysM peptidoglycan-binding domain-containing protein n=1 Tax=Cellulosimicrobium sp. Marseille-Q4280 TaxID=2937992 RepID=UPI00203CEB3C|nr:LysM peptidoglycan-binding domain-containing protein [Cellulosimicrobium sp. Marseille-Q4280]